MFETLAICAGVAGVTTATAAHVTFNPRCTVWGPVVSRGSRKGLPRIALTFDDGPTPGATDKVLDVLCDLDVRAAFFVIGRHVEQHPALVRRAHEEGHLIAGHSFDHLGLGFLRSRDFWREQLDRTDRAIEQAIGLRPRLFRPPLGIRTWFMARAAAGHITVTWSRRGFDGVATSSQRILDRLIPHSRPGDIITLHDGISPQSRRDPKVTIDAIRPLIHALRNRGFELARLDELTGVVPYCEPAVPRS